MSGPHQCARVHTVDRPGAVYGRVHVEPGVERVPGDPGADLRPPLRAGLPADPDRRRAGGDLPSQARRLGSPRRHRRPPSGDPEAEERAPCRLHRGRTGLADRRQRSPPDRLRGGDPRAARRAGGTDADQHPVLPTARGDPRRGDSDHHRHGRRPAPEHSREQSPRAPRAGLQRDLRGHRGAARQGPRHPRAPRERSHPHRHRLARVRSRSVTRTRSASAS